MIVITANEARHIADCLASVAFADEWIVVDSGSRDGTAALARERGATVIETDDWPGFGPQKNRALAAARGEWVLSVDADERVTPALAAQIRAVVEGRAMADADGFTVSRLSSLCGQWMHHGDWFPDPVLRLFRRGRAKFSDDIVHERVVCDGAVGALPGTLLHHSVPTLENLVDKLNRYSTERAQQLHRRGKRGGLGRALGHGGWAFVRSYLLRRGFLDGRLGFVLAASIAEGTFWRYMKMAMLDAAAAPTAGAASDGEH